MTIYAVYNAFNNPVMGYLSDRTHTRWGRRIPYIMFGTAPYVLTFALLFFAPFDGLENAIGLLVYFAVVLFLWEGLGTVVSTAYYALLPEMFRGYRERTDVSVRMNVVQTIGLLIGVAAPAALAAALGWPVMAVIFAVIAGAALYIGLPGMVEPEDSKEAAYFSLVPALKATLVNRSFVTVVIAQTMRFFATNTLAAGMIFYMKYSIGADEGLTSAVLAAAFIAAGLALWPWRQWVANRTEPRTTLMLAYALMGLAVIPLGFVTSVVGAVLCAILIGIALAGLILMGDVIVADVVDEDEMKTGQHRAGMYFGMSSLIITLSGALVSVVFGLLMPAYGYDSSLATQPASVGTGFRIFMTVPSVIGSVLAVVALVFYPLHGARLREVKAFLRTKRGE
jgi:GPH family glycoside/pentoside/hexuronide:cation symporter